MKGLIRQLPSSYIPLSNLSQKIKKKKHKSIIGKGKKKKHSRKKLRSKFDLIGAGRKRKCVKKKKCKKKKQ